eukprot:m.178117 g.178117  ORF g.178117 m.178117 type:complete len:93 (-) comp16585_c0_seq1:123-401(-)
MDEYLKKRVAVVTQDGRFIVGTLRGFDQATNLILTESAERVVSSHTGVETVPLGLYIVRGDNVATVLELDVEHDESIDLATVRAEPIPPIVH